MCILYVNLLKLFQLKQARQRQKQNIYNRTTRSNTSNSFSLPLSLFLLIPLSVVLFPFLSTAESEVIRSDCMG